MAQEFLDDLGVDSSRKEQCSSGVPEVVEPDAREPCLLQKRLERAVTEDP
jgi:hypothetical protein